MSGTQAKTNPENGHVSKNRYLKKELQNHQIPECASGASFEALRQQDPEQLKRHLLDARWRNLYPGSGRLLWRSHAITPEEPDKKNQRAYTGQIGCDAAG